MEKKELKPVLCKVCGRPKVYAHGLGTKGVVIGCKYNCEGG